MLYVLAGVQLNSACRLPSFDDFAGEDAGLPTVDLQMVYEAFPEQTILHTYYHKDLHISVLPDGWLYTLAVDGGYQLAVSADYMQLTAYISSPQIHHQKLQPLLRTALECASAAQGVISLHSACVELEGKAVCFTASSGVGKSTRAGSWVRAHGATMLSGDRPQLHSTPTGIRACGVPWDGKEGVFINRSAPLLAICQIIRSDRTLIRKLTAAQARRLLMRQCFIPMWDTDPAAKIMLSVTMLSRKAAVYTVYCGPDETAAREVKELLYHRQEDIWEEETDMKIKSGYVLREIAGEYVVMPTGDNIATFNGTIVLNALAAFVWQKLENGMSRDELLVQILSEYEIDQQTAQKDLDELLVKFRDFGVLE